MFGIQLPNGASDQLGTELLVRHLKCVPHRNLHTYKCLHAPVFLLPFPLLRVLELKRRQRNGLVVTFALGLITITVSLARFIRISTGTDWDRIYVWSMAEMCIAIIVVSLPALKYLLRYWKTSNSQSESGQGSYYTSDFSGSRSNRRRNQISCSLGDGMGSDVELNRIVGDDAILTTKEVSVETKPGACGAYDFAAERKWAKEVRAS